MSDIQDLLEQLPIDQLATQVGASPAEVRQAVQSALPALLMGMDANAQDPAGEASLARAVSGHSPTLLQGGVNVGDIDVSDGEKIIRNVFGDNEQAVVSKLGSSTPADEGLISKLLPMLAPIVMAWLAGKLMNVDKGQSSGSSAGGGVLGGILGSILGGGAAASSDTAQSTSTSGAVFKTQTESASTTGAPTIPMPDTSSSTTATTSGGGLGDLLGGGVLGDLLGGLLGGGKR